MVTKYMMIQEEAYPYMTWIGEEVDAAYYEAVKGIEVNPGMDKSGFKMVFSPQHGTANIPVRTVLKDLGYDVIPVLAQCAPDPNYTNTKSPNPEVDASYELAIKKAKEVDADVVVITDPDGDRLGVVAKHVWFYYATYPLEKQVPNGCLLKRKQRAMHT